MALLSQKVTQYNSVILGRNTWLAVEECELYMTVLLCKGIEGMSDCIGYNLKL